MTFADYMEHCWDSPKSYFAAKEALRNALSISDTPIPEGTSIGSITNPAERTSGEIGPAASIRPPSLTASVAALMASKRKK